MKRDRFEEAERIMERLRGVEKTQSTIIKIIRKSDKGLEGEGTLSIRLPYKEGEEPRNVVVSFKLNPGDIMDFLDALDHKKKEIEKELEEI